MPKTAYYLVLLNLLLPFQPGKCALRFNSPYFLILNSKDAQPQEPIVIQSADCPSGGFSNTGLSLQEFCVTGVWLLTNSPCANEESERYIVSGRDSCFKLNPDLNFKAKRLIPLIRNMSDFQGYAYAIPKNFAYVVRLNPDNKTELKPISQPRSDWSLLTINFGTYGRYLNEYTSSDGGKMGDRNCYKTESEYVTQVYSMSGNGDATFYPYKDTMECLSGFNKTTQNFTLPVGTLRDLKDDNVYNSTYSFRRANLKDPAFKVPFPASPATGVCSGDASSVIHPDLNLTVPDEKFPKFPHMQPPTFMDEIIADEVQNTAQNYMEFTLYKTPLPVVNGTQWKYIVASSIILSKFCCTSKVKYAQILELRRLFRLTYTYFAQYYPYEEPTEPFEEQRILAALGTCMNSTLEKDVIPCITVNMTDSCPEMVNSTTFNKTMYNDTNIEDSIVFEVGNLDYVTEMMWKAGLFVHYFCAPYFSNPTDHSAFYSRLEAFFNPLVRKKWVQPRGVHRIYELLLSGIDFRGLANTVDTCVATAKEISEYNRWLSRPGTFDFIETPGSKRKKRAVSHGNKNFKISRSSSLDNCVPESTAKLFCVKKQFDVFDKNLIFPKQDGDVSSCVAIAQKKQQYKYIHADAFGTRY